MGTNDMRELTDDILETLAGGSDRELSDCEPIDVSEAFDRPASEPAVPLYTPPPSAGAPVPDHGYKSVDGDEVDVRKVKRNKNISSTRKWTDEVQRVDDDLSDR